MYVVVGGVIEKDGKVLLIQEAQERCYGKWNLPAGRLDVGETLLQGVVREIKEETNCDVEVTGVLNVANRVLKDDIWMTVIFSTKLINEDINFDKNEILDVKWFEIDEILNNMDELLRSPDVIKQPVENLKNEIIAPLEIINVVK